ncbi:MAG: SNF2-related protein [Oscillospiraceae bacterium]|nr:SNF2-related protein [Oscillospiraceae bacterium]
MAQFAINPRSREAVQLVREIYGGIKETLALSWTALHIQIAELAEAGRFSIIESKPTPYEDYLAIKSADPDNIVFYQIGDFFEVYNGDAETAARVLDILLTSRSAAGQTERIPMIGIPFNRLPDYTNKLYEAGYGITISSLNNDGIREITSLPPKTREQAAYIPEPEITVSVPQYTVGDRFEYNGKPHEIDRVGDFIRLRNIGTPSEYPIFDYMSVSRQDFERRLSDGEIVITTSEDVSIELAELDFDTAAQTVLERVMQDADFAETLENAQSRGALRNPLNTALDKIMNDHGQDETHILRAYHNDDDFNDRLFDFVYRRSWETKTARDAAVPEPITVTEQTGIETPVRDIPISPDVPPPVFFVDWDAAQYDVANLDNANSDLVDVLDNGLIGQSDKETVLSMLANGSTNDEITALIADVYSRQIDTMTLTSGETADYSVMPDGIVIDILDRFNTKLFFTWADIAPVVRALAVGWQAGQTTELEIPVTAEDKPQTSYIKGQRIVLDLSEKLRDSFSFVHDAPFIAGEFVIDDIDGDDITVSASYIDSNGENARLTVNLTRSEAERYTVKPVADKLYDEISPSDETTTAYYLLRYPNGIGAGAVLSYADLALIKEQADAYVICAEACHLSGDDMARYNIEFRKMPRDWYLLPEVVREQIHEIKPEYENQWNDLYTNLELTGEFEPLSEKLRLEASQNFRITDDHLGEGGAKTKFRYNLDAIHVLKDIEFEKRAATPDEQQILSRYVGWGGLPQAFDPDNKQWENEYLELNAALTPEEWESARASTVNAHYTTPTVIRAVYETVERLGFRTGNILEPSCGIGNFFGLLPESMSNSKLYGVELDSVTARIAKQLYPKANIKEMGFEKTDTPDAFFDLAVGNVPFGDYGIADKRYDKHHFSIHNYFFAKTLDQVRPGGVIAFLTSKFTLDEKNPNVRKYIAQRAELLGAVRLPNNAFLKNAGTEVTSDIIFLQKRARPIDAEPDWVHLGLTHGGISVNKYYSDNPEMILGTMAPDERMNSKFGTDSFTACLPIEGADLAEQLKTALLNIQGQYTIEELDDIEGIDNHAIPADPRVRNFSYALVIPADKSNEEAEGLAYITKIGDDTVIGAGRVYYRENSMMYPVELPAATLERIKGMIALRDCVHELIDLQLDEWTGEAAIRAKQNELNILYDRFNAEYGLINSQVNNRAFNADSAYYLLCSLEILDEDGQLERKADMFTKRTIKQRTVIEHVNTASEALAVSLSEKAKVDIEYMAGLTGFTNDKLIGDLENVIYFDFGNPNKSLPPFDPDKMKMYEKFPLVTAEEYLSGNIREKLFKAERFNETFGDEVHGVDTTINVYALKTAMPKDLDPSEIAVRLGSTWIAPEYVQQFMYELLRTNWRMRESHQVKHHEYTGEWQVTGKGRSLYNDILANVTYGTNRMNAYQIIDDTLNLRDVRVYDHVKDADGKEKRVLNKKETTLAQQKQEQIKQAFKDWIWQEPRRRQTLVKLYNERFNSVRPREYDGSHITFSGISPEITLRKHQLNAIAHGLYGGNLLLAHVVGAGKTFEMVAIAMEGKRLGLCHKSLMAVPNHLTEQWAGEFLRLYPTANILVATKKDFEMRNRKKFCAKIATGDYDAVIIGHSQLEKIPMSSERQERLIREQIWEIEQGIEELKRTQGERFSIKQLEKTKKSLLARLEKLLNAKKRDDVVTYEQLGVDKLFIDEAHGFKNLFMYTKMRNVAGLSTSEAQKSSDLFMKCRYMDELTGNKGVVFATGTPISNSMTEMYTMQRYLQFDTLAEKGLTHFDSWASIFGETQTSIELAPEGTGYRARTRFALFHNLPELMYMFKEVADIQTADMLNLPVPEAKYENVIVQPSERQKEMVQELSKRAALVHSGRVDAKIDNMLKITTDGRKIGLDQRLINPLLSDFEGSKVNACTDNVYRIWDETKDGKLTQLVFCDFSTPNKNGRFNVYDDVKTKLLERGVPEHEIAFIHDADTETRKKELFAKVRQGSVRILFGSTFKMGSGTNVQDRLIAIHDADCPWRPADLEQRAGRIVRQGNKNEEVQIYRYATNGTFDSYLWQTVEKKQKFIAQIMTSKSPVRSCEDVDETALSYAEIKALCAGNPLIAEKMNLDVEVAKLRMLKSEHQSQHYRLEDNLMKYYPQQITAVRERISGIEKDIIMYNEQNEKFTDARPSLDGTASTAAAKFAGMTVNGVEYMEKEPAAKALLEACKGVTEKKDLPVGKYMGFDMSLQFDGFHKTFSVLLRGNMSYTTELGTDAFGNITRINNTLADLPKKLSGAKSQLDALYQQQEAAKQELEKPFALADELAEKEARLALLNSDLNIDGDGGFDVLNDDSWDDGAEEYELPDPDDEEPDDEYERQTASAKSAKPSLLEGLRSFNPERQSPVSGKKSPELDI